MSRSALQSSRVLEDSLSPQLSARVAERAFPMNDIRTRQDFFAVTFSVCTTARQLRGIYPWLVRNTCTLRASPCVTDEADLENLYTYSILEVQPDLRNYRVAELKRNMESHKSMWLQIYLSC